MKATKKMISILLALALLVNMVPIAQAKSPEAVAESGPMTISGTNSFGNLLSKEIEEDQSELEGKYADGYSVVGLTITDAVATVEYSSLEVAILVVAIYTEDGLQMLLSGKATVDSERGTADVVLEGDMPEYFLASAHLVDAYDYSPLCPSYDTPMYTREMQNLVASTVDDYDADRVLKIGEDNDTNFAVYNEATKVIDFTENVNVVVKADEETATYIIENADEAFTSLNVGDIVAYTYGEDSILLAKVGTITVDGTTVTIIGADLEIEEVFSHVKMELEAGTADVDVIPVDEEGVIYEGLNRENSGNMGTYAFDGESSVDEYLSYKFLNKKWGGSSSSCKLDGQVGINIKVKFNYYVSWTRQYVEYKMDIGLKAKVSLTGKAEGEIPLGEYKIRFAGISIGLEPKFKFEATGKVEISAFIGFTQGMSYERGKGIKNLGTKPKVDADFKIKASIFIGIDLNPKVEVLEGAAIEAELELPIGVEVEGKLEGLMYEKPKPNAEKIHSCNNCMDMELKFKIEFEAKIKFLKSKKLTYTSKSKVIEAKIGDMYWSIDHGRFGWGSCPYVSYRVTVYVRDQNGNPLQGSEVSTTCSDTAKATVLGTTNSKGVVVAYVESGTHQFVSKLDGEKLSQKVGINQARKIYFNWELPEEETALDQPNPEEEFADYGEVVATGTCGENVKWVLNKAGTLFIFGIGEMNNCYIDYAPWYELRSQILNVVISNGITRIGEWAFCDCASLTSITVPKSVTSIGNGAFVFCTSLSDIQVAVGNDYYCSIDGVLYSKDMKILHTYPAGKPVATFMVPSSVTSLEDYAFACCTSLTNINISDSVISIGEWAFINCDNLTNITIPDSVASIGREAFSGCASLLWNHYDNAYYLGNDKNPYLALVGRVSADITYCNVHENTKIIGDNAFANCTSMINITIPGSVVSIGKGAFSICSSMASITIPDSVNSIGAYAFDSCSGLKDIYYSGTQASWEAIRKGEGWNIGTGDYTVHFLYSDNLEYALSSDGAYYIVIGIGACAETEIVIPNTHNSLPVREIGEAAFQDCCNMTSIKIPESVVSIGEFAFFRCEGLIDIDIPHGVISIGESAFRSCDSLNGIVIPDSVISIGDYAFQGCAGLTSIVIPDSVTSIGEFAFAYCDSLNGVVIPNGVNGIGQGTFAACGSLTSVSIPDSVTSIGENAFADCYELAEVYYGGTQAQWEAIEIGDWNDYLTDATIYYNSTISAVSLRVPNLGVSKSYGAGALKPASVFDGDVTTDETALKTATFTGLVAGRGYVLLVLASMDVEDFLASSNLLFIDQGMADSDGKLTFSYRLPDGVTVSYVMACGASDKDLADAEITFPTMMADEEAQAVDPIVIYQGQVLTEGKDYVIVGKTDYTNAGAYTCYIRGIRDYTGMVECQYTVLGATCGDVDGDDDVDSDDAIYLLYHTFNATEYPLNQSGDMDGDGDVDSDDAIYLLYYTFNPEEYPLP